ncbi:MAG: hypothetical protein HKM95_11255 [Inquilinus sp.]|nr:hypothetical protein [Inquilinus sp.]
MAIGIVDGAAGLRAFTEEKIREPRILGLASKVRYEVDPNDPYPENYVGALTVRMRDGRTFSAVQPCLRGGRRDPLSDAELEAKFRANASYGGWPDDMAGRFIAFSNGAFAAERLDALSGFRG